MNICANGFFKFHGVGQGLFYSGMINFCNENGSRGTFKFVYDCGSLSKNNNEILRKEINSLFKRKSCYPNNKIDLVIISHLHEDHVNGLPLLFERFEVQEVVLPYFTPLERLMLALEYGKGDEEYYRFISNPFKYLIEKGVKKIIAITGGEGDRFEDEEVFVEPPAEFEGFESIDWDNLKDENNIPEELEKQSKDNKIIVKKHNGHIRIFNLWFFKFFFRPIDKKQVELFKECTSDILKKCNDIFDILKNRKKRKELQDCYKKINDINETSLMVMHMPIGNDISFEAGKSCYAKVVHNSFCLRGFDKYYYCCPEDILYELYLSCRLNDLRKFLENISHRLKYWNNYSCRFKRGAGHVLTGDIDFKNGYDEIKNHFSIFKKKITVLQVPHHGSRHNWNANVIKDFSPDLCILPAGIKNQHNHPHAETVKSILTKNKIPIMAYEGNYFLSQSLVVWKFRK